MSLVNTQTFRVCIFSVRRRNATYGLFVVDPSRFSVRTWGIRACCCTQTADTFVQPCEDQFFLLTSIQTAISSDVKIILFKFELLL